MGKADDIYQKIKTAIIDNVIKPNSPLSENEIAKKYNVSRSPVREAIRSLEKDRLVTIIPGRGTFVSDLNLSDISNLFEIRIALATLAAKNSLAFVSDFELDELTNKWIALKGYPSDSKTDILKVISALDRETHHCLTHKTPNPWLRSFLSLIEVHVVRMTKQSMRSHGEIDEIINYHVELIRLAKSRDIESYITCFSEHIKIGERYMAQSINIE